MKGKKTGTHMLKYVLDGKMHQMDAHKLHEQMKDVHKVHEHIGKTDMLDMHKLHEHVDLGHKKKIVY